MALGRRVARVQATARLCSGVRVMTPGIYTLTAEQYHADPAPTASLSSSVASILLDQSPLHAWLAHPRLNHSYVREDANSRFDLGSAAHMMLLERREDKIV